MKTKEEIKQGCGKFIKIGGKVVTLCGDRKGELCLFCQVLLNYNQEVIKMIEEIIEIKKEERILYEHNLLRDGKSIHQKGYFKNLDFQIQANAMIYVLEELIKKLKGDKNIDEKEKIKKKGLYDYKIGEINNEDMINGIMKAPNKLVKIGYTFQDKDKTQMEVAVKHKDFIEDEDY